MDRLRDYRALIAVVDSGSFTAAAELLGLPRSTLSTMISGLEDRLGARLLHRTTRVVTPTEEGQRLAERARGVIEEAHGLETMFERGDSISGRVRMSMPGRIAHNIVIPALPAFIGQHPDLLIDLRISDEPLDLIAESLDLVLRVGLMEDSSLICRRLGKVAFVNCASARYLDETGEPKSPDDVKAMRAVAYGPPGIANTAELDFGKSALRIKASIAVDSTEGYIQAGVSGLGIISLPRYDAAPYLRSGVLTEVLPDLPPTGVDMAVLYPSRKHLPPRIKKVRDWVVDLVDRNVFADR